MRCIDLQDLEETKREAAQVVELLDLRQGGLTQTLDGGFPELRNSVWQSEISVQSAVQVWACCSGSPSLNGRHLYSPQPSRHAVCSEVSLLLRLLCSAVARHALSFWGGTEVVLVLICRGCCCRP